MTAASHFDRAGAATAPQAPQPPASGGDGVSWRVIASIAGSVLAFFGAMWANSMHNGLEQTRATLASQAERVAVVEAMAHLVDARLIRIESKIDDALSVRAGAAPSKPPRAETPR